MKRVVHFEILADDPERVADFYKSVFDWSISRWEGPMDYWLVSTGDTNSPGIDGGIGRLEGMKQRTVNTVVVPSVDDFTARVTAAGGTVVMPRMAVPGVGYLAYCADPEGCVFGIMETDMSAGSDDCGCGSC